MRFKFHNLRSFRFILISVLILVLPPAGKIYYDTNTIEIRRFQIADSSFGESLTGLKLAFIADLHTKGNGPREEEIKRILEKERPDFILMGGDLIPFTGPYEPALAFLDQLGKVYAVLGNTEYSNENGSCILCHQEKSRQLKRESRPVFLRNSQYVLKGGKKAVTLIGVDDPVTKKNDLSGAIRNADPASLKILLAHSPEIFEEAVQSGMDLIFAGHNHGGQIFLVGYLRKVILMDPALEYLEGFYQKGKTLMYVSRGVGTSFLPFRLGVKPEIAFFTFSNNSINPINPTNPINSINSFLVSNDPSQTIFTGLTLSSLIETFNILTFLNPNNSTNSANSTNPINPSTSTNLFDFETEGELNLLDWTCHKWFELSQEHATSGRYSLKMTLPPAQYPGVNFKRVHPDWSNHRFLKMDLYNPAEDTFTFHVRIDDEKSGWEYADRFDVNFEIKKGKNSISIPLDSLKTNFTPRPLNLQKIERFMVFVPRNASKREFYLDNIRLE